MSYCQPMPISLHFPGGKKRAHPCLAQPLGKQDGDEGDMSRQMPLFGPHLGEPMQSRAQSRAEVKAVAS